MDEELNNSEEEKDENKSAISSDLIRGHINTIILRTLYDRDKYGYEIMDEIEAKSHGQYSLKQPTLYSALKRLESQGYINAYWKTDEVSNGGRRKYYTLTDSGREVTEKNQSEWEYSRTVIDSLISDKNFDFTQPPPSHLDFKILKSSTSRVPIVKEESEEEKTGDIVSVQQPAAEEKTVASEQISGQAPAALEQAVTQTVVKEEAISEQPPVQPVQEQAYTQPPVHQNAQNELKTEIYDTAVPVRSQEDRLQEEKRIHENYLKLISEPVRETKDTAPYSERLDTEKLIYNNKPETERDYKNLINNLFVRTIKQRPQTEQPQQKAVVNEPAYDDAGIKASKDGLTVSSTEYVVTDSRRNKYTRGGALVKCSLIIAVIMLVEFALSLAFQKALGVSIGYPIVILTVALAQLLIFLVLTTTDFGKSTRRPTNHTYLSTTIILAIIAILIIFVTSLLLNVNFTMVGDVMAKIIIPCIVALNIPLFATLFYVFSK